MIVFLTVLVIALLLLTIFACSIVFYLFTWIMSLLADNSMLLHEERGERLVSHDQRINKVLNGSRDLFYTVPITKEDKQ